MKIINKSKSVVIAEEVITADTFFTRAKGLLGRKELSIGHAMIIRPCDSIHTFFMQFPIDVLFVNRDFKVIRAISNLQPFRLTGIYFKSRFAVELPAGTLETTHTQAGDFLSIE